MLRVRERTNSWPSFVDLFANLVIVLMFLLIVFVFLWTSTSVFNKNSGNAKKLAELKKITAEQTEQITNLKKNDEEARELLIAARNELLALNDQRTVLQSENVSLSSEKEKLTASQMETVTVYENKLRDLQEQQRQMSGIIESLQKELGTVKSERAMDSATIQKRATELLIEIGRLNSALVTSEQQRKSQSVEYAALSERLNKAMADKLAVQAQMNKYQSQFFSAVKDALSGVGGVDVSSDRFLISSDILFPLGGFKLSPEGKNQIKIIAGVIKTMEQKIPQNVSWVIRVDGHTDRFPVIKGTKQYKNNTELSLLRARTVVNELEKNGVNGHRLIPAGFGETNP